MGWVAWRETWMIEEQLEAYGNCLDTRGEGRDWDWSGANGYFRSVICRTWYEREREVSTSYLNDEIPWLRSMRCDINKNRGTALERRRVEPWRPLVWASNGFPGGRWPGGSTNEKMDTGRGVIAEKIDENQLIHCHRELIEKRIQGAIPLVALGSKESGVKPRKRLWGRSKMTLS